MSIRGTARRYLGDENGNIAILAGAASIPLLIMMGGAIDLSRYTRYKVELSNAVDAASLALARNADAYAAECQTVGASCPLAKTFVANYVNAYSVEDTDFDVSNVNVTRSDGGFLVTAQADMDTLFLPLGDLASAGSGIHSMDIDVTTGVTQASNRVELALVLDNTGSMNCAATATYDCAELWNAPQANNRIAALRSAATLLVNTLMKGSLALDNADQIKIALVPFEGTVNVASTDAIINSPPFWIAWSDTATSTFSGVNFDKVSNKNIGHKLLFDKIKANTAGLAKPIKWAGCVEMRSGAYELSDAAPVAGTPDSLFTPYFWPDEPDTQNQPAGSFNNNNGLTFTNNYLRDTKDYRTNGNQDPLKTQKSLDKYNAITWISTAVRDNSVANYTATSTYPFGTPFQYGPNKGCPRPILPLTNANGKQTILDRINGMLAYWSNGTFIPVGLMWGWHVLSNGEPYTQGIPKTDPKYNKTVKAIVLFTDGDHDVAKGGTKENYYNVRDNNNKSRYSAYNYISPHGRLSSTKEGAETALDTKLSTLCTNVKDPQKGDIRLYTISFGTVEQATKTMLSNCATLEKGARLYYHAPNNTELQDIFRRIGEDLSNLHLSM